MTASGISPFAGPRIGVDVPINAGVPQVLIGAYVAADLAPGLTFSGGLAISLRAVLGSSR